MWPFNYLIPYKKILLALLALLVVAVPLFLWNAKNSTIEELKEKNEQLEENATFSEIDTTTIVENGVTDVHAQERAKELMEIMAELERVSKEMEEVTSENNESNATLYGSDIFDRVYLK